MNKALFLLAAGLLFFDRPSQAACSCDPDVAFTPRAEWTGPLAASANVDVNLGNSASAFVRAAYWQIAGSEPPPAFLADHVNRLSTTTYWRRIDTVNTILNTVGPVKPRVYSDPWTTKPAFNTAPCKNEARDIGAVLMMFFRCPAPPGYNCGMEWANTHGYGMNAADPLYGAYGYMKPEDNKDFFVRELMDARYAGLQFFLPNVYGPETTDGTIDNLVTALDEIAATSITAQVQVGYFDDTSSWNSPYFTYAPWNNPPNMASAAQTVTSAAKIFNHKWKPYFEAVPSQYWYRVNGRPFIYFYNGGTLGSLANSTAVIQSAKSQFYSYFGVTPWVAVDTAFFASGGMAGVADSRFTWKTVYNGLPLNKSRFIMNSKTLDHAMVRWDSIGRDGNGSITITATASDEVIKDTSYLSTLLSNSTSADLLVLATWNDLGEGTGINRNYDYWYQGNWMPPDAFMSLIRASQSGQSCPPVGATATYTPTPTASRTPSPTPTVHGPLVADLEQAGTDDRTLWNNGGIVHYKDAHGSTSDHFPWGANSASPPGTNGSASRAACYAGSLVASSPTASIYPYSFIAFELAPNGAANAANGGQFTDVLPYSLNRGIKFDYYAVAGIQYQVELNTQQVTDYSNYSYAFSAPSTGWHSLTVYFPGFGTPALSQPAWGSPQVAFDATKVGSVLFQPVPQASAVAYSLCIDNLTFDVPSAATATPSRTASPTRSPTPTRSATATPSASPSASPTRTASPSPSLTPSASPSASPTEAGSATQTSSVTASPTVTETALGSFTETPTHSASPTDTPSASASPTSSASPSSSATATEQDSPTVSPSPSATATEQDSPTASPSPSRTVSPLDSPTASPSPSATALLTATPTRSVTGTPTRSPTPTHTPPNTPGNTATPTPVGSPVILAILNAAAAPNPQSGPSLTFAVHLNGPAESLDLGLFSSALVRVGSYKALGSFQAGWNQVSFTLPEPVANGIYFGRLMATPKLGSRAFYAKSLKVMILN